MWRLAQNYAVAALLPIQEYLTSAISLQRFLVPVYHWKTVEIMSTDVKCSGIGGKGHFHTSPGPFPDLHMLTDLG